MEKRFLLDMGFEEYRENLYRKNKAPDVYIYVDLRDGQMDLYAYKDGKRFSSEIFQEHIALNKIQEMIDSTDKQETITEVIMEENKNEN